jgi:Na+/melibiose symporter-like transporter
MKNESQEQLKVIEEMIANAKLNISEGSIFYLIWGWLVVLAAAINYYLLVYMNYDNHWLPWPILMSIGGLLSMIIGYRKSKKGRAKTYVERALNYLWIGFGITLFMVLVGMLRLGPEKTYPIIIFLYGLGTFVSGGILKFKPLLLGGIACWLIGLIAFYTSFANQLILISLAVFVSYIIPGHLLANAKQDV